MKKRTLKLLCIFMLLSSLVFGGCGKVGENAAGQETERQEEKKEKEEKKGEKEKEAAEEKGAEELDMGGLGNFFQKNYQPSGYGQEDVDSDTVQWICAAYAVYTHYNEKDLGYIGGTSPENVEDFQYALKENLRSGWKIVDRDTAIEQLNQLLSEGQRTEYRELAQKMADKGLMDLTEEELIRRVAKQNGDVSQFEFMHKAYQECGIEALDAWDYCRALQVLGDCYQVDYISLEECLDQSLVIAKKLQEEFDSWEEMVKSYLYGYYNFSHDSIDTKWRWEDYQELTGMEDGPYATPFDTKLTADWRN